MIACATPPTPFPWVTSAVAFTIALAGIGILSVCRALAYRLRHGITPPAVSVFSDPDALVQSIVPAAAMFTSTRTTTKTTTEPAAKPQPRRKAKTT